MNNSDAIHVEGYIGNIFNVPAEAIVNSANRYPSAPNNRSIDGQLLNAAGPKLADERRAKGKSLRKGEIVITDSYGVKDKFGYSRIIHINVPGYNYDLSKTACSIAELCKCYYDIFKCALSEQMKTIVLPLLGVGYKRFPVEWSLMSFDLAFDTINNEYETPDLLTVKLVLSPRGNRFNPPPYTVIEELRSNCMVETIPVLAGLKFTDVSDSDCSCSSQQGDPYKKVRVGLGISEKIYLESAPVDYKNRFQYTQTNVATVSQRFFSYISPFYVLLKESAPNVSVRYACNKVMHIQTRSFYNTIINNKYDRDTVIKYAMAFDLTRTQCDQLLESANFKALDPSNSRDKHILDLYKQDYDKLVSFFTSDKYK